jgi:hypothetical protein
MEVTSVEMLVYGVVMFAIGFGTYFCIDYWSHKEKS